jgi:hypothetical protein
MQRATYIVVYVFYNFRKCRMFANRASKLRDVARYSGKPCDFATPGLDRNFPSEAPTLRSIRIQMEFQLTVYTRVAAENAPVLI